MHATSLESKTIRPGSLSSYSYYHSARRPVTSPRPAYIKTNRLRLIPHAKPLVVALLVLGLGFGASIWQSRTSETAANSPKLATQNNASSHHTASTSTGVLGSTAPAPAMATPAVGAGACSANTLDKAIIISVSQRRLWACEHSKTVRQSPVITGMSTHESTMTPPGTYKIYAKTTDTTLTGNDQAGAWSRPVYYWMPFLDNQHGTYGFHDATWRPEKEFGKIDPKSDQASHGCVELPLGTQKWLYHWAPVGTVVTIET